MADAQTEPLARTHTDPTIIAAATAVASQETFSRRLGATPRPDGVEYCAWAPDSRQVQVQVEILHKSARRIDLVRDAHGFWQGRDSGGRAGDRYQFALDHDRLVIDPVSRFQPEGVFAASEVIDPVAFRWTAKNWQRPPLRGRVIYELHVGTFTRAGTFRAAIERLDALADLSVNTVELMPVAEFAGTRNWGYDGVFLFAPSHHYGRPDDVRAFIDAAHQRGIAVVLDVVYNHVGPVGSTLRDFTPRYFHQYGPNQWGDSFSFDGEDARSVREFFLQNAAYWLDEFRIDGLRLDATHAMHDHSHPHIVAEIAELVHRRGAFVIGEDERNERTLVTPRDQGGWGLDGVWADDFHHSVRVALTGERTSYLGSYHGTLDEWLRVLEQGWLFCGEQFPFWQRPRGSSCVDLPTDRFVFCISNHDQVGNRADGLRLNHAVPAAAYRAVSVLLCVVPYVPMLFMGQEWAARTPFHFFADFPGEAGTRLAEGRRQEFAAQGVSDHDAPDPRSSETFTSSQLDWNKRDKPGHEGVLRLYRDALRLRATNAALQNPERSTWAVAKVASHAIALRWSDPAGDWLLLVSLNAIADAGGSTNSHLLLESRPHRRWQLMLSSEDARYGGGGDAVDRPPAGNLTGPAARMWREV